jgi:DNA-binding HxlR family transcriptional regulator
LESPSFQSDTCEGSCPMGKVLDLLSGRWAFPVLYQLLVAQGPIRFGQLQRAVGRVTQKELTRTLRTFEERGLVTRQIYAEVPPRVEYRLTALGESLGEPLCGLARWAQGHLSEIDSACPQRSTRPAS